MSTLAAMLAFLGGLGFLVASGVFVQRLFRENKTWGVAALVFPPAGVVAFATYARRFPRDAILLVIGLYLLLACGLLWGRLNASHAMFEPFTGLRQWLTPAAIGVPRYEYAFPSIGTVPVGKLVAEFDGKPQRALEVEWVGDTLRFFKRQNGQDAVSLRIQFPPGWKQTQDPRHLVFAPTDESAPTVTLFVPDPAGVQAPEIVVLRRGYWLRIDIDDTQPRLVTGNLQLLLPTYYRTWISGTFAAHTDSVRYAGGEIDRRFDSTETLRRIAVSHVNAYLWRWLEAVPEIKQLRYQTQYDPLEGSAMVTANLGGLGVFEIPIDFRKGEYGWYVEPDAVPILAMNVELQQGPTASGDAADRKVPVSDAAATTEPQSAERFSTLRAHIGQEGVVFTVDGRKMEGVLQAVVGNQLKLRRQLGRNQLTVSVSSHNFARFVRRHH